MISHYHIIEAHQKIEPFLHRTPLEWCPCLSGKTGSTCLKCEHLQKTGSFKFRGALNKVLTLKEQQNCQEVVAASTGNHGLGVALASQIAKTSSTIYVPQSASENKLNAIASLGGKTIKVNGDSLVSETQARLYSQQTGIPFIERVQLSTHESYLVVNGNRDLVGVFNLSEITRGCFQNAFLGFHGISNHTKQGYMSAGLKLVLHEAFYTLQLHRLEANIQPANLASIHLVQNNGFRKEGFSPKYLKIGGEQNSRHPFYFQKKASFTELNFQTPILFSTKPVSFTESPDRLKIGLTELSSHALCRRAIQE